MKVVAIVILAICLIGCLAGEGFKGTEKDAKPAVTAPTITIPDNLRIRVNLTESFNLAVGLDMVLIMFDILGRKRWFV
jgi:hypothetical protein